MSLASAFLRLDRQPLALHPHLALLYQQFGSSRLSVMLMDFCDLDRSVAARLTSLVTLFGPLAP
jgi:hypothetical protein